jgi:hypothetical protein
MTVPYRKKLIEVGMPWLAIDTESARAKSIRHGHPSTLHQWWARRPLAACRAVLSVLLVDDPNSDLAHCKADGTVAAPFGHSASGQPGQVSDCAGGHGPGFGVTGHGVALFGIDATCRGALARGDFEAARHLAQSGYP